MSASSSPTRAPSRASASARLTAVVDLPTPPLPEATATTLRMPGSGCRPPWTAWLATLQRTLTAALSDVRRADPAWLAGFPRVRPGTRQREAQFDVHRRPGGPPTGRTSQLWRPPGASRGGVRHNSRPTGGLRGRERRSSWPTGNQGWRHVSQAGIVAETGRGPRASDPRPGPGQVAATRHPRGILPRHRWLPGAIRL